MPAKPTVIEQDNYEVALRLVREKWRALDPVEQSRRCGADLVEQGGEAIASLPFLYRQVEVTHPAGEFCFGGGEGQPAMWEQILILHYLTSEGEASSSEKLIAYNELPDGKFYDAAFQKRTKNYLLGVFGRAPDLLRAAAKAVGADITEMGDISFRLQAFPNLRLQIIMWQGDDEFPPDASILLEERIQSYLNAEDVAVLGGMAVGLLAKTARKIGEK